MLPVLLLMAIIPGLPKVEDKIGNPLSPYAVTKYVNELYAQVYASLYGMELIGSEVFQYFWPQAKPAWALCSSDPSFCRSFIE